MTKRSLNSDSLPQPPLLRWEQSGWGYVAYCGTTGMAFQGLFTLEESLRISFSAPPGVECITAQVFNSAARAVLSVDCPE